MILAKLKQATALQHQNLEQTVDIFNQIESLVEYSALLCKFYSFYAAVEPQLAQLDWNSLEFDFHARRKTPLLEQDLNILAIHEFEKLPLWQAAPPLRNFSQGLGCLYVLEGATLGGQIISRQLNQKLNINAENGAAFFNSYGKRVSDMWRGFGNFAAEYAKDRQDDEIIIKSARETFDAFKNCISQSSAINALER